MSESTLTQKYNATTQTSTAYAIVVDTITAKDYAVSKIAFGAVGSVTYASAADPLPVTAVITGTVAATQSGTWTVTGAGGTFPVTGTFWQATQPVSLASVPSHAVTNAGTFAVQVDGNALTALQKIDDSVFVDDAAFTPATSSVNVSGFVFDDTAPDSVDEGDAGAARMSANRSQYMQIRDGSALQQEFGVIVTTAGELTVWSGAWHTDNSSLTYVSAIGGIDESSGNVKAIRCTTGRALKVSVEAAVANIAKAEDAAHASGDTGVFALAVRSDTATSTGTTDGDYSALITDANGRLHVNVGNTVTVGSHAVTNAGTFAVHSTIQAGTALIGKVSASHETSTIYDGTTALVPKFAVIAASSSGNNTLVAAVASKKIRVLAYNFIGNGAVNAKFQSGAGGTDLTGLKYIAAAGGGICAPYNPLGWFETASNTLLNLNLSGAVAVGGELTYIEV
jgi:hypothetical protein